MENTGFELPRAEELPVQLNYIDVSKPKALHRG